MLARRLKIPAIVLLLPVGFLAGVATKDVQPDNLLGELYQPFVSVAVGIILFDAGLKLSFGEVAPGVRKVVARLIAGGVVVTWVGVTATVALLFDDMDKQAALLVGAILVVSGPTVVLPLLAFIRPTRNVRSLLKWEGTLVDPIGALLGVLVFQGVSSGGGWRPGEMLVSLGVGVLVAAIAAPLLLLLLREVQSSSPRMVVPTTLMVVVAAVVGADLLNDDSGLTTATLMGIAIGNQRRLMISAALFEFGETLVQLLIGVLFVLVAASVSPGEVEDVMPQVLVLLAVMVLLIRPAAVGLTTLRSDLSWGERGFVAWMAPRGIVAGATAASFGPQLAARESLAPSSCCRSSSWRSSGQSSSTGSPPRWWRDCSDWPARSAAGCSSSAAIRGRVRSLRHSNAPESPSVCGWDRLTTGPPPAPPASRPSAGG